MRTKTIRYALIAGVVFIWGMIAYKVIAGLSDTSRPVTKTLTKVTPVASIQHEDYYLFANYPDPFILEEETDNVASKLPAVASAPPSSPPPIPAAPVKPDLSFIQYHGTISNKERKATIALVNFRGTELLVKEKDRRDEVLFKKIYPDRIDILYNGKPFTINKN